MSETVQRLGAGALVAILAAVAVIGLVTAPEGPAAAVGAGLARAVDAVGWVVLPQLLLACAVGGLALECVLAWMGAWQARAKPGWLDAALESALLLGMLGTLVGMVNGFAGLTPSEIEPGPLLHGLGTALRSSVVGFAVVLVGVWVRSALPEPGGIPS